MHNDLVDPLEKANLKRIHTIGFNLYKIIEITELKKNED